MRNLPRSGRDESASTTRCPNAYPTRPASLLHHRVVARDRCSFEHLDAIAEVGRELELLALDRAAQSLPQLTQSCRPLDRLTLRRPIRFANVFRAAVHTTEQLAHAVLEGRVAARAAPS